MPKQFIQGLGELSGRRILLLQGPVGPFFRRLADDLRDLGGFVKRINFNGGDWLFAPAGSLNFRDDMNRWPQYFERVCDKYDINTLFLYGDCRPLHKEAIEHARSLGIDVFVFEEGYIRPDYVTLEQHGVNGHTSLSTNPIRYLNGETIELEAPEPVGQSFWYTALWALLYYTAAILLRPVFARYRHHRPLTSRETIPWIRSFWRRFYFRVSERGILERLTADEAPPFFLVPLQVFNDSQLSTHSSERTVAEFIEKVTKSFAAHAGTGERLVFKHHPMDRGYVDYTRLLRSLGRKYGLSGRLVYLHDQHLPTLLGKARGLVTVNSTVGMSALLHEVPVITLGRAYYDIAGLTYRGSLDSFWRDAAGFAINMELYRSFRNHVIVTTQINGNFSKRLKSSVYSCGMHWRHLPKAPLSLDMADDERFTPLPSAGA